MEEFWYLACDESRPYAVFETLKAAKDEVQPWIDKGYSFHVVEVRTVAVFHPENLWTRENIGV